MGTKAKLLALVILCGALSCDMSQQGPDPVNEEIAAPASADAAFWLAVAEWELRVGAVHTPGDTVPLVRWFEPLVCVKKSGQKVNCLRYEGLRDVDLGPVEVYSMYWPFNAAIHVTAITSDLPSGSGLAHETLHWVLASSGLGADGGHKLPIWTQQAEVRLVLIAHGY